MVIKRYIKKNGKVLGPYFYKNVRGKDGKVKSIYLGKNFKEESKHSFKVFDKVPKENLKYCSFVLIFVALILNFVLFKKILGNDAFNYGNEITGFAVSNISSGFGYLSIFLITLILLIILFFVFRSFIKNKRLYLQELKINLSEGFGLLYKNDYEGALKLFQRVHYLKDRIYFLDKETNNLYLEFTLYIFCYKISSIPEKLDEVVDLAKKVSKIVRHHDLYKKAEENYKEGIKKLK
ncbi:hypothetical protein HY498_02605 [Candidatus Woesearchaeota archaeon]|nr:hypothetical protein [Candidatus Woesearchaeota archaeon]